MKIKIDLEVIRELAEKREGENWEFRGFRTLTLTHIVYKTLIPTAQEYRINLP